MLVLSCIDIKGRLVLLVVNRVSVLSSNLQMSTLKEVVHNVFQLWFESLSIDCVEINQFFVSDLDVVVRISASFVVVNKAPNLDSVVFDPFSDLFHFVPNLLEKHDFIRAGRNQDLSVDKLHQAEILFGNPLIPIVFKVFWVDTECLSLSIETINPVFQVVMEAPHREVLEVADHHLADGAI
jgi:hypothetical protein